MTTDARRARLRTEAWAVGAAWAGILLSFLIALALLAGSTHELAGTDSIGSAGAIATAVVAAAAFATAYALGHRARASTWRSGLPWTRRWLDASVLVLTHAAIAYLGTIAASELFETGFQGLEVDAFGGASMVAVVGGMVGYVAFLSGSAIGTESISLVLAAFLVSGVAFSMATASNPDWWQEHFSALGMGDGLSAWAFNVTLVISGIVVTTLATYVTRDLRVWLDAHPGHTPPGRAALVHWLLSILGMLLAVVGLVPADLSFVVHLVAATGMAVVFAAIVVVLAMLVQELPRSLDLVGFGVLLAIGFAAVLWMLGYFGLTGVEFACAGLIIVWLTVFVRNIAALVELEETDSPAPTPQRPEVEQPDAAPA